MPRTLDQRLTRHMRRPRRLVLAASVLSVLLLGRGGAQEGPRFFDDTGISVDNAYGFLRFWEQHQGSDLFGPPITGIVMEANVPVQYFERGRLEYRDNTVVAGALGRERTRWRAFTPAARPGGRSDRHFGETGFWLRQPFLSFWERNNGAVIFGAPLSEPLWEQVGSASLRVQYFERARLEERPASQGGGIVVSPLGRELALAKGLIRPVQRPAVAILDSAELSDTVPTFAHLAPPTPTPIAPTPEPTALPAPPTGDVAGQVIEVDLTMQSLTAWQDGAIVYQAPVATGKDGFETPTGSYRIGYKVEMQTMRGSLGGETWVVPNVPHVMYFNGDVALHGAYWHNAFGTGVRMSHGCVNLSLADAAWLYAWAADGATVVVH